MAAQEKPSLDGLDHQLVDHLKSILKYLDQSVIPKGRSLKTIDLHFDAQTGDVNLDIVDEAAAVAKKVVVEEQNRLSVRNARIESARSRIRAARKEIKKDKWQAALSIIAKVEHDPILGDEKDILTSVQRMRIEIEKHLDVIHMRHRDAKVLVEPLDLRKVRQIREEHSLNPQNIFFIYTSHGIWVGRKTLSEDWIRGEISELFCARIRSEMLLGKLTRQRSSEDAIHIFYKPVTQQEANDLFAHLNSDQASEVVFPFVHLSKDEKREITSPENGWYVDDLVRTQLLKGEAALRNYSVQKMKEFLLPGAVLYDPACSTGDFLSAIQRAIPNSKSIGQDLSQQMVEYAKKQLDVAFCSDAIHSAVGPQEVDVAFVRFLNSEVVTSKYAEELFDAIMERIKIGGFMVLFGHTPLLVDSGLMEERGAEILQRIGWQDDGSIFQYYVIRRH